MTQGNRDHDELYLQEDRKRTPKEYFKFVINAVRPQLSGLEQPEVLDVGCATGDFLWYVLDQFPGASCTGVEYMASLAERARSEVPSARILEGDICNPKTLPTERFDAVFMNGVHSIFDDLGVWLENLLALVKPEPHARAYVFGIFNPADVDVLLKARDVSKSADGPWQSGWNCFSCKSVSRRLTELGVREHEFLPWTIGLDLPPHETDPLRSWTFPLADGQRAIVNGTQLLHRFMLLTIAPSVGEV